MKAFLMYRDRDFDPQGKLPVNKQALIQDLELDILFNAMALGDELLFEVAQQAVLSGINNDLDTILYRQSILKDCLKNPAIVRAMYDIAVEAIENEKKHYLGLFRRYPGSVMHRSVKVLQMFVVMLKKLRDIADKHAHKFKSQGYTALFAMIGKELDDEYLSRVKKHLRELEFDDGVLLSAELGQGNKGSNYILHKTQHQKQNWVQRVVAEKQEWLGEILGRKPSAYTLYINERDESGFRALSELRDRGINAVANATAQSADHILGFFRMLRTELAFYMGCLNLQEKLMEKGEPISFPLPVAPDESRRSFNGLYDVCLALSVKSKVVGNEMNANHKDLVMITGANQGGKSTFLRSLGLSQLMMQCGMFVPAESFYANICDGLFTHYRREEDTTMNSGKLDEELSRMSDIIDHITPNSILLFNESFAATNEREGSEIARQVISALLQKRLRVFFVTHLFEFAKGFYDQHLENAIFLRAERQNDGVRTFKIREGEPLQTSYGKDLYSRIFETEN